jgi:hypothetical protein
LLEDLFIFGAFVVRSPIDLVAVVKMVVVLVVEH